jgi:hypothetical protein
MAVYPILRFLGVLDEQEKGAWSSLWAVASDEFEGRDSGAYVVPYMKIGKPSAIAESEALSGKLWSWSEEQLKAKGLLG